MSDGSSVDTALSAYLQLRRHEQIFVDLYVECGSGPEALRRMGRKGTPKTLRTEAWRIKKKPGVREAIEERTEEAIEEAGVTKVLMLRQAARIANLDLRKLCDEDGQLLPAHQLPEEIATALGGLEVIEKVAPDGRVRARKYKYRHGGRTEALKLLMQYLKLLVDRHELSGPGGAPMQIEDARERNLALVESVARRIAGASQPGAKVEHHPADDAGGSR